MRPGSKTSTGLAQHGRVPWDLNMIFHTLGRTEIASDKTTKTPAMWAPESAQGHSHKERKGVPPNASVWFDLICAQPLNRHSRTGQLGFHDVVALRTKGHDRLDRFWNYDHLATHLFGHDLGFEENDTNASKTPRFQNDGSDLVPVTSCFGGLAMYRMEAFYASVGCDYDPSFKPTDCEHVAFHACLRRKGFNRMFVDPLLSSYYERGPIERACVGTE
jgi:hypothetical protein